MRCPIDLLNGLGCVVDDGRPVPEMHELLKGLAGCKRFAHCNKFYSLVLREAFKSQRREGSSQNQQSYVSLFVA